MRTAKTLIRLGGSASSLGGQIILLVLSRGGSFVGIEMAAISRCPLGQFPVNCFVDPCMQARIHGCHGHPKAVCQ